MKRASSIVSSTTQRFVWGGALMMSLLCVMLTIRPVLAQEDQTGPRVKIDVKRQYNDQGNLSGYDSSWSWSWSGRGTPPGWDTLFGGEHFSRWWDERLFAPFDWEFLTPGPHLFFNPDWPREDSSDFPGHGLGWFHFRMPHFPYPLSQDSADIFYREFEDFWDRWDLPGLYEDMPPPGVFPNDPFPEMEDIIRERQEFMERYRDYIKEHRKLLDKYFGTPGQINPGLAPEPPDNEPPDPPREKPSEDRTGKI
ncbi:MAG: hypothetical protein JW861_05135 [Bacteroidales bacterium]|nr:hypothetical protein [Bacteroidales bacterium]